MIEVRQHDPEGEPGKAHRAPAQRAGARAHTGRRRLRKPLREAVSASNALFRAADSPSAARPGPCETARKSPRSLHQGRDRDPANALNNP